MASGAPELSIIIPAYNEAERIGPTLERVLAYLAEKLPESEVLVVDDGSKDRTCEVVEAIARDAPRLRLLRQPRNRGKGAAVRRGALEAKGAHVLFCDADLATPIEEVEKLMPFVREGYDVVIGSRALDASDIRARQPRLRETMGKTFNVIVQMLAMRGIRDTQCGFKLFTRKAADRLFPLQTIDGFAFDVELLVLAQKLGLRVREVPVVWFHVEASKVSPLTDATRMFADVVTIRWKTRRVR